MADIITGDIDDYDYKQSGGYDEGGYDADGYDGGGYDAGGYGGGGYHGERYDDYEGINENIDELINQIRELEEKANAMHESYVTFRRIYNLSNQ